MTEIIETKTELPAKADIATGGKMGALIPQGVDETFRLAEGLVMGGGAPKGMNKMQAFTAIAKGLEVGFAPMQALATIASINGRLSIYGDGLIAIARRGGNRVKETLEGNADARIATCTITRADTGEVITRSFSVQDAKRAKLWQKPGPWSQYPDRMLAARARAFAIRDGLADKLFGLHVAEEVQDIPQEAAVSPSDPPESVSRLQRRLGTAGAPDDASGAHDDKQDRLSEAMALMEDAMTPDGVAQHVDHAVEDDDPSGDFDDDFNPRDPADQQGRAA
ncbi:hypothetical protein ACFFUB_02565 [Algimonas porphyrae]|uniref:RecT-like ssDNA binding protein n=1 Tax=Algimonas porphyrae TaxID=1128113 RepID=A0ABQ5V071_9PROT|nr:hypothetical protein [Algimonas porphyrae]GLQ20357.1 hypothetical protein GCM10007854_13120 [Algimonas porphyrae]